jgi:hypothetical protein
MEEALRQLFTFGEGEDALFLIGSADIPATEIHGDHFIPARSDANAALLDFFGKTIAKNISSFPIPTTVSSQTYKFIDGVPTPSLESFGPIVAERAQTIGRGRLNAGVSYTRLRFADLRGVDMGNIRFRFVHENVDFPNCDIIFGDDCSLRGVPLFENDIIDLNLDMDVSADVWAFHSTFGITAWLDISVVVPVVSLEMIGESQATIAVSTGNDVNHFFGGTQENPKLTVRNSVRQTAAGIGDVAARLKARVAGDAFQMGILGEVRLPTGREEDFLGTGAWNAKAMLILSGSVGDFSPHANLAYEYRGSEIDENELHAIIGFDQKLADWVTLAVDLLTTTKAGDRALGLPEPVHFEAPFARTVELTNIPDRRDDVIDGSIGFKFRMTRGLFLSANVLVPLNEGGMRPNVAPTLLLEYTH